MLSFGRKTPPLTASSTGTRNSSVFADVALIAVASIALRIIVYAVYYTLIGVDTRGYAQMAHALLDWDVQLYDGYRTPGYPLFMAALGIHMELIRVVQHALGVGTAVLVYLLARMRVPRLWALAAGLFYGLSMHFVFYEAIIQTEALANFLVALIFHLFARRIARNNYSMGQATWIGLLCTFLTMVRPQYLPILLILFLVDAIRILRQPGPKGRKLFGLAPGAGGFVAAVGGWVLLNRILFGSLFLTLWSSSALMSHTIRFAEHAGPEWQEAGAIMVKWREYYREDIARLGSPEIALAPVWKELMALYHLDNPVAAYHQMNRLNRHLILRNPGAYSASVLVGCANFWRVSLIMYPELFKNDPARWICQHFWPLNKLAWLGIHLAFWGLLLAKMRRWRQIWADPFVLVLLTQIFLGSMLFQALLSYSNSSRYALSTEALVLVALLYLAVPVAGKPGLPHDGRSKDLATGDPAGS